MRYSGARFEVFNKANSKGINSNRFLSLYEDMDGVLWITTEDGGLTQYAHDRFKTYTTADGLPNAYVAKVRRAPDGDMLVMTPGQVVSRLRRERFEIVSGDPNSLDSDIGLEGPAGDIWHRVGSKLRRTRDGKTTFYSVPRGGLLFNQLYQDRQGRLWIGTLEHPKGELWMLNGEVMTRYSVRDGLPLANVLRFCEDHEGTMWFGTDRSGLVRFKDGRFTAYTTADGPSSNAIECIFEDREGTLWVGTRDNGITRVTRRVITTISEKDGARGRIFYPILEDRSGSVWFGFNGVNRLKDGKFTYFTIGRQPFGGHPSYGQVQSLCEDREGNVWVGDQQGLFRFENGRFIHDPRMTTGGMPNSMFQDSSGAFWLGFEGLLIRYHEGQARDFKMGDGLLGPVQPIYEDRKGRIWIGTYGGLAQYVDGRLIFLTEKDGPSSNRIRAIYEDADGVLWIGTYDGGLNRFKDGKFTSYTTREGMFSNGVFAILEDRRDNFWMSSNQGIYRVRKQQLNDFAEGKVKQIDSVSYGKADGMLNSECNGGRHPSAIKTRDGRMWFPTFHGIAVVDPDAVTFNDVPPPVVIEHVLLDREELSPEQPVEIRAGQDDLEIRYAGLSFIKPEHARFRYRLDGLKGDWVEAANRRVAYFTHLPPGSYTFRVIAANSDGVWNLEGAMISIDIIPPFWRTWWFAGLVAAIISAMAIAAYRLRVMKLERARALQQEFSRRLIQSQEKERKRIGAELHDSLGQSLVIIRNLSLMMRGRTEGGEEKDREIDEITAEASRALGEVKEISYNLRPYHLDRLGLARALESLVDKVSKACTIEFFADIDDTNSCFTKEEETGLYRIAQESLNNLVKHSGATRASLTLRRGERDVELTIRDNGRGFGLSDDQADSQRRGFGLIGISERARMLGGVHKIESEPGKGTTVTVRIALRDGRDE